MKTIGFITSLKENEKRRALIPEDIKKIKNKDKLYFEENYGEVLGIKDEEYKKLGCNIVKRDEILKQDIICDPKIGDAEYLEQIQHNRILWGWIHAVQNKNITDKIIKNQLSAYAWEDMYEKTRHCFWRNNEIAGEAAVLHAFICKGIMPYNTKVAVIGTGNTARGAIKILTQLGAEVAIYARKDEELFKNEFYKYDVIVNCILWDTNRKDHILYEKDLKKMKKNSMIIDVSCDRNGGIESSIPTTIEEPTYIKDNILHYAVDHTPTLFYHTATLEISKEVCKYADILIEEKAEKNVILKNSLIIKNGIIIDERINKFQNR